MLGEAITFRQLLDHSDTKERVDLLVSFVDEITGTVFGAMAANRFEDAAHKERRDEGELSAGRLGELWVEAHERLYGDSVELTDGFATFWSYYPHFRSCRATCTRVLVRVAALARHLPAVRRRGRVVRGADPRPAARGRLRASGELVQRVGFDLDDPGLWNRGLDALESLVVEAEELAAASACRSR